jgi:hypothetical protein
VSYPQLLYSRHPRCYIQLTTTSTTVISIIRLQSLVQFATSSNPTYDSVPTAYWSVLEAFVGIFCICMPALRRFLANVFPKCFGSTQTDSKYRNYDEAGTPNKVSNGRAKTSKTSISFGKAFGSSGITKTTETTVESRREDDEVMLVELGGADNSGERRV